MTLKNNAVNIGRVVLGLFFVADGVIKLTGISRTVQLFERIGWGQRHSVRVWLEQALCCML